MENELEFGMTDDLMTIREMCDHFGVTARTLRFYEQKELLSPIREGQKRLFTRRDRARLKLILRGPMQRKVCHVTPCYAMPCYVVACVASVGYGRHGTASREVRRRGVRAVHGSGCDSPREVDGNGQVDGARGRAREGPSERA